MSLQILKNVKLDQYTSWLVGGEAEEFCLPETRDDLLEALKYAKEKNKPYSILWRILKLQVNHHAFQVNKILRPRRLLTTMCIRPI